MAEIPNDDAPVSAADHKAFLVSMRGEFEHADEHEQMKLATNIIESTTGYLEMARLNAPPLTAYTEERINEFVDVIEWKLDIKNRYNAIVDEIGAFRKLPTRPRFTAWARSVQYVAAVLIDLLKVKKEDMPPSVTAKAAAALFRVCACAFEAARKLAKSHPVQFTGPGMLAALPIQLLLPSIADALGHVRPILKALTDRAPIRDAMPFKEMCELLNALPAPLWEGESADPRCRAARSLNAQQQAHLLNVWPEWLELSVRDVWWAFENFEIAATFMANEMYGGPPQAQIATSLYHTVNMWVKADPAEVPTLFTKLGREIGSLGNYPPDSLELAIATAATDLTRLACEIVLPHQLSKDAAGALRRGMQDAKGTYWTNVLKKIHPRAERRMAQERYEARERFHKMAARLEDK